MRPQESFVGQPIRSLQTMLRVIAEDDSSHPTVIPDGIYGQETMNAVSYFQRKHGLPVTGVTDQDTWDAVTSYYEDALIRVDEAYPIFVILEPGQEIRRGERNPNVYLVQAILKVMSEAYDSVSSPSMTGILDEITADSLSSFQALARLPMTGNLDKKTWKQLALHYPLAGTRRERRREMLTNY